MDFTNHTNPDHSISDENHDDIEEKINVYFMIVMGCLIFFMQAGFAYLEAGSVRSKNTTNILMKNLLDVSVGSLVFWAVGFGFAFGEPSNAFVGESYFFLAYYEADDYAYWFVQLTFAVTAVTIVSGAMAERTQFMAYMIYSCVTTGIIYPFVAHWAWGHGGWLKNVSFHDNAGSGVVHMVGGTAGLMGSIVLGPRLGRFDSDGMPIQIEGHSVPLVSSGGFIISFGFLAFNGVSHGLNSKPIAIEGDKAATAVINTILSGSAAAITAMVIGRRYGEQKHWSLLTAVNGGICGMVAICAGSDVVEPWGAVITGCMAGASYILWCALLLRFHLDDPIQAVSVHLGGGLLGVLSTPFLNYETGIFPCWNGPSFKALGWNVCGAVVIFLWTATLSLGLFGMLKFLGKLRVSKEVEIRGLDLAKHGEAAYPLAAYGHGWEDEETVFTQDTLEQMEKAVTDCVGNECDT